MTETECALPNRQRQAVVAMAAAVLLAGAAPPAPLHTLPEVTDARYASGLEAGKRARIESLVRAAATSDRMQSLLVMHRGELLVEAYFHGAIAVAPENLKSVTKTLSSILVGIAIDDGLLPGVDGSLADLLPAGVAPAARAEKRGITLRHLLTMSSGLPVLDYGAFQDSPDWVGFLLDGGPLRHPPGAKLTYDTNHMQLVSAILERATHGLLAYANRKLMGPIGGRVDTWRVAPDGVPMGGNDAYLRPRDLIRLGELFRTGGTWEGRRVVSADWVRQSLTMRFDASQVGDPGALAGTVNHGTLKARGYGYCWWLLDFAGEEAFGALGHGGQELLVFPRRELVVLFTSHWPGPSSVEHYRHLRRLLDEHVLPMFPPRADGDASPSAAGPATTPG